MQVLYGYFGGSNENPFKAEKDLIFSVQKSYQLFFYLLKMSIDIVDYAEQKIETAKSKMLPTHLDLNPNTRFIENKIVIVLRNNSTIKTFLNNYPFDWDINQELIKKMYNQLIDNPFYNEYMNADSAGLGDDKKIIQKLYTDIIAENEELSQFLEEQSIYWNDDLEFIISMIVKLISTIRDEEASHLKIPPMFANKEDEFFTKDLLHKTIAQHEDNEKLISNFTKNWDVERIAQLDVLLMEMALVELTEMEEVPVKVTLNEYIELARYYSTEKSWAFINGILDNLIPHLRKEGRINKKGKGMLGETPEQENN
jgi:N utilization substance protein B